MPNNYKLNQNQDRAINMIAVPVRGSAAQVARIWKHLKRTTRDLEELMDDIADYERF